MRPKIKVSLKPVDVFLEAICIVIFVVLCIYLIFSWAKIPDVIPTHFGISGQADSFGSKNSVFYLLPVILGFYLGLTLLQRFPNIYNYIVDITEKNALIQYTYAVRMMRFLKLIVVLIFSYIEFQSVRTALGGTNSLGIMFVPVASGALFGTLGIYVGMSIKNK